MAAKKAKKAKKASKSAKRKDVVSLSMKLPELERIVDAARDLGAPGFCVEKYCDDPTIKAAMEKRAKKD
jgi:hypothetical protein